MNEQQARERAGKLAVEWTKFSTADTYVRDKLQKGFVEGYMAAWRDSQ